MPLARWTAFKPIKATLFYADRTPLAHWFMERVLPGTSEIRDATENLKLVAAAEWKLAFEVAQDESVPLCAGWLAQDFVDIGRDFLQETGILQMTIA